MEKLCLTSSLLIAATNQALLLWKLTLLIFCHNMLKYAAMNIVVIDVAKIIFEGLMWIFYESVFKHYPI